MCRKTLKKLEFFYPTPNDQQGTFAIFCKTWSKSFNCLSQQLRIPEKMNYSAFERSDTKLSFYFGKPLWLRDPLFRVIASFSLPPLPICNCPFNSCLPVPSPDKGGGLGFGAPRKISLESTWRQEIVAGSIACTALSGAGSGPPLPNLSTGVLVETS